MLREIQIKNFVLLEDVRLTFDGGLNVLTGETGAGKTIVFDAVGLLLGERFRADAVRTGAERSTIAGVFDAPKLPEFRAWWDARGYDGAADEIVIRREGTPDGRSRAFLNDQPVTLEALSELGEFLVDVHGQNEHQQVLKPAVQLACLDRFGDLQGLCAGVEAQFEVWRTLSEESQAGVLSEQERMQRIDLYRFQLQEIDQAKPRAGEDTELSERLPELKNAERLRALAQTAYGALYQDDGAILERLGQLEKIFITLQTQSPSAEPLARETGEVRIRLEEMARTLQQLADRWETDPQALEAALTRQEALDRLKKKYGGSLEAVLAHGDTVRRSLESLENADVYRKELDERLEKARLDLERSSQTLSARRRAAARELGAAVQKQLKDLGLAQATFQVTVVLTPFSRTGIDRIVFEWAPNPGEGIRPLKDIASGGEMSRAMLALKTVLARADAVGTLVFDEIDAGVGGATGQAVGKKLRGLGRHHQILCVSHLPQIAACANAHFHVSKRVSRERTFATVVRLDAPQRLEELARLLGGAVTSVSLQHAKELLGQSQS